jgi:single-strand DNA-binding protein
MNSLKNRVQLIGHLGVDPEMKTIENGTKLARLRLATNETFTNAKGEKVTETQWHNVVAWGKTAELAEMLLTKGAEAAIEGKLVSRSYTDKDGQKKYVTEVVVDEFLLLSRKSTAA